MKTKPKTPYQRLLEDAKDFANKVAYRQRVLMWHYPKDKLGTGWNLADLWERVAAAEQLGYDVKLEASEKGLMVNYVKKAPPVPYEWQ